MICPDCGSTLDTEDERDVLKRDGYPEFFCRRGGKFFTEEEAEEADPPGHDSTTEARRSRASGDYTDMGLHVRHKNIGNGGPQDY